MKTLEAYKTFTLSNGKTINIVNDTNPESPREWENLGTMVCFHKIYNLGDEHSYRSDDFDSWDELKKQIENNEGECIFLPLYLYDHSGITMNTTGFSCRWDSGQVGLIYVSKKKVREEFGVKRITKKLLDGVLGYLVGEVETYDQYIRGDVYKFKVYDSEGELIDSCGGFYSDDFKKNGMLDCFDLTEEEKKELENLI